MKKTLKLFILFGLSFFIFHSCKKKEEEEEKPHAIEVNEQTKVMPESSRQNIKSIDLENYTFVFDGTDDFINGLEVGNIIVDGISDKAPYGYLRKITAIAENKGEKQCQTELVTLPEAVPSGSIDFNTGNLKFSDVKTMKLAKGVKLNTNKDPNFTVFDFTFKKVMVDPHDANKKVTISGETALELDFFFDFDWGWDIEECPTLGNPLNGTCLEVSLFETGVEINQNASIAIVSEAGASFDEEIEIATFTFDPWVFSVGPVPVVFVPKISLKLNAEGNIIAVFSSSASESLTGRLGVKYENGSFGGINDWDFTKDFVAPQLEVNASAEAHIGPQVSLLLYGAAGPFVNLTACEKFEGTLHTGSGNWDLEYGVGIAAEIGLEVDLLGWEQNFTFDPPDVAGVNNQYCLGYWSLLHLEDEPFDDHIYISYPTDGSGVNKDSDVTILTEFTGQTPDEVQFFIDGTLLGPDTSEPFEYIWNTTGYSLGSHTLLVKEFVGGTEISSDEANVVIENAHWEAEDMSSVMTQSANYTRFQSMDFKGSHRWISGTYASRQDICSDTDYGFVWHSGDNGETWEEMSTYPFEGFEGPSSERNQKIKFINETTGYLIENSNNPHADGGYSSLPRLSRTEDRGDTYYQISFKTNTDTNGDEYRIDLGFYNFMINNNGEIFGFSGNHGNIGVFAYTSDPKNPLIALSQDDISNDFIYWDVYGKGNTMMAFDYDSPEYILSNDGGYTWNINSLPSANYQSSGRYIYLDSSFISENIGYVVVKGNSTAHEYPIILKTTDAGNTWEVNEVTSLEGVTNRFDLINFVSENVGYAWGNEYDGVGGLGSLIYAGIYKTDDGGLSWNRYYEIPELIPRTGSGVQKRLIGGLFFNGPNDGYAISNSESHTIYHFTKN